MYLHIREISYVYCTNLGCSKHSCLRNQTLFAYPEAYRPVERTQSPFKTFYEGGFLLLPPKFIPRKAEAINNREKKEAGLEKVKILSGIPRFF